MNLVRRCARPMLAAVFVTGGVDALRHPGKRTEMAAPLVSKVADLTGLPEDPELMVRANGATMALAGLMLATGRMPRVASTLLAASLIPTTVVGHPFWSEQDPQARKAHQIQFSKNLSLLGGVLLAAVDTAGKPGLTWRARNAAHAARREARLATANAKLALS
ncbi:DoxX family protein [Gephyromycinifex aptenodytis]|uniref:DoxX family protein n=1 Tax=Gephyromycinifex aptenodytis TaxID=2716227 RepID=UPI0014465784|nr:DoxX family protein [Gephyromycinifex aptenodytis]